MPIESETERNGYNEKDRNTPLILVLILAVSACGNETGSTQTNVSQAPEAQEASPAVTAPEAPESDYEYVIDDFDMFDFALVKELTDAYAQKYGILLTEAYTAYNCKVLDGEKVFLLECLLDGDKKQYYDVFQTAMEGQVLSILVYDADGVQIQYEIFGEEENESAGNEEGTDERGEVYAENLDVTDYQAIMDLVSRAEAAVTYRYDRYDMQKHFNYTYVEGGDLSGNIAWGDDCRQDFAFDENGSMTRNTYTYQGNEYDLLATGCSATNAHAEVIMPDDYEAVKQAAMTGDKLSMRHAWANWYSFYVEQIEQESRKDPYNHFFCINYSEGTEEYFDENGTVFYKTVKTANGSVITEVEYFDVPSLRHEQFDPSSFASVLDLMEMEGEEKITGYSQQVWLSDTNDNTKPQIACSTLDGVTYSCMANFPEGGMDIIEWDCHGNLKRHDHYFYDCDPNKVYCAVLTDFASVKRMVDEAPLYISREMVASFQKDDRYYYVVFRDNQYSVNVNGTEEQYYYDINGNRIFY